MSKINIDPPIQVRQLKPIKFKDKVGRNRLVLQLRQVFGFMPEQLIIDKVPNENNKILISAVITKEELVKEKKVIGEVHIGNKNFQNRMEKRVKDHEKHIVKETKKFLKEKKEKKK